MTIDLDEIEATTKETKGNARWLTRGELLELTRLARLGQRLEAQQETTDGPWTAGQLAFLLTHTDPNAAINVEYDDCGMPTRSEIKTVQVVSRDELRFVL